MQQERKKVTENLFPYIFDETVAFYQKKYAKNVAKKNLAKLGINENTASRYIGSLDDMLHGKGYKSTMNMFATDYFLQRISNKYGEEKLQKALSALKQHLEYYTSLKDRTKNSKNGLWGVYYKYRNVIKIEDEDVLEQNCLDKIVIKEDIKTIVDDLRKLKASDPVSVVINTTIFKRNNKTISQLKYLRGYRCQMCGIQIPKADGNFYIEGAHIDPKKDRGNELPNNILILCPNHHKEFDYGKLERISRDDEHFKFKLNDKVYDISLKLE
ncbi:HNH endonuclease [Parabacteroides goldsteinii]|uniref:HNH endonuclease n=1 Tax=Parabacteroides goldsteinii TaxID=328812 RepID=UPI0032BFFA49